MEAAEVFNLPQPMTDAEHIRKLLKVNEQQAARIKALAKENATLRAANKRLKDGD